MTLIPIIELCRHCPGIVTSMGVSVGLAAGTIMKGGTPAQMERWGLDLLTAEKVGAWAITEPNSGSDALGGMTTMARRDGDEYIINGSKTWITNGPYADTIVLYSKLDDGSDTPIRDRPVLTFILDKGHLHRRQDAAFTLGFIGAPDSAAIDALCRALQHSDPLLRMIAAQALGKIGDTRARPPLRRTTADENEQVAKAATKALKQLTA